MAPDNHTTTSIGQQRKQEELRTFKIKAEGLKLTLKGLQKMLDAEKEKLLDEKGEVEGLAREKGLVLIQPGTYQQDISFNTTSPNTASKYENYKCSPPYRDNPMRDFNFTDTQIGREMPSTYTTYNPVTGRGGMTDWGQGDACRTSRCVFDTGIRWDAQHCGDYSAATWDNVETSIMPYDYTGDEVPEQLLNTGFLDETLYKTRFLNSPPPDFIVEMPDTTSDEYLLEDHSFSSQQHILALMKEVDHITQVIQDLEKQ